MQNRDRSDDVNRNRQLNENEPSRRERSGEFGSSTGRSGSIGNMGGGGSDRSRSEIDRDSSISRDDLGTGRSDSVRDRNDSSEGRH